MELNKDAVIIFKNSLEEGYTASPQNTIKVEDLLNKLENSAEIRSLTQNIDTIINDPSGIITGGHIKLKLTVEHSIEELL